MTSLRAGRGIGAAKRRENLRLRRPASQRYITTDRLPELKRVEVQVFGMKQSPATRAALRCFAERRVKVHFVDLEQRAASKGELTRFAQQFGVAALLDRDSRRFRELGLHAASYSEARWLEKLVEEPLLLRMPLVRYQHRLTIGPADTSWREWVGR